MNQPIQAPHRRMGEGERLWARVSEAGSTNGCMVMQLRGHVDPERMHRAAQALAQAHPLLRARIGQGAWRDHLLVPDVAPVPWRVQVREQDTQWMAVVERELNEAITPVDHPLWRLCLLLGADGAEVIMTMHHAVSDGTSGYLLMAHLLQAYEGRRPLPAAQALPPAQDTLLIQRGDWRQWLFNAQALLRMTLKAKPHAWRPAGHPDHGAPPETRVLTVALPPSLTELLQARSQAQGCTLNGLLGAVYMQAAAVLMGQPADRPMVMTSAVGVRHLLPRTFMRTVGYYVAGCEIEALVKPGGSPWPLAAEITAQTTRQMRARPIVLSLWLRRLILTLKPEGHQLVAAAPRTSRAHFHLTNMGRMKVQREAAGLHVQRCFHVSSVHLAQRPFVNLAAVCLDGEFQLSFSYCWPMTTGLQVQRLADSMLARLHEVGAGRTGLPDAEAPLAYYDAAAA